MLNLRRRIGQSIQVMADDQVLATITLLRRISQAVVFGINFGDGREVECLLESGRALNVRFGSLTVSIRSMGFFHGEVEVKLEAPAQLIFARSEMKKEHKESLLARRSIAEVHQHV